MLQVLSHAALAAFVGALASCENLDNFDVTVGGKGVVPKKTLIDELLGALSFDDFQSIDLSSELANQGVTKDDVDSVRLVSFTLRIESPAGATFDFLESVTFYAEAEGAPKAAIARVDSVPAGATEVALSVQADVDLKPYVVAPKMRISGEVKGTRPDQETTVAAEVVLDVDVTVPGC